MSGQSDEKVNTDINRTEETQQDNREKKLLLKIVKSNFFMPQTEWKLNPGEYIVGRYPSNDIVLPDPYVSRRHARIFYKDGEWYIEDLDSTNGTIVNNEDIKGKGPIKLDDGSEIIIGLTVLSAKFVENV